MGETQAMITLRAVAAGLACLLAAFGQAPGAAAEETLVLHPATWEGYQEYLKLLRPGAFAVSRDGSVYGYSYCPEARCKFNSGKKVAISSCEESGGEDCVIFAFQGDIKLPYSVVDIETVGACPSGPVPTVTIAADMPPPSYDFSYDITGLTEFHKLGRAGAVDFELLGLAIHSFDRSGALEFRPHIRESDGVVCAGFHTSEIRLRMASEIYVVKDFPKGSCLYDEVLAHEERHHEVARRLFGEFAAEATRRLAADLRNRPFVQVPDPYHGRVAAHARVNQAIDAAYADFITRYAAEQDAIDTTAEYTRIANACPAAESYLD